MKTGTMVDYAVRRTKAHINRFDKLYDQIKYNRIDPAYLSDLESQDNIFPQLDYRIYNPRLPVSALQNKAVAALG